MMIFLGMLASRISLLACFLWRWKQFIPWATKTYEYTTIVPVKGWNNDLERCLLSIVDNVTGKVIFCLEKEWDTEDGLSRSWYSREYVTCKIIQKLHSNVDIMLGYDHTFHNPKLANLYKGWLCVDTPYVMMIDSNVELDNFTEDRVFSRMNNKDMVSSPCYITEGTCLESSFLNTYHAMFLYLADLFGWGFLIGKLMFFRKDAIDDFHELDTAAEDNRLTKIAWKKGLKTGLITQPVGHISNRNSTIEVLNRQLRWLYVRKMEFPWFWVWEPLSSNLVMAGQLWYFTSRLELAIVFLGFSYFLETIAADIMKTRRCLGQWIVRDALIPVLWFISIFKNRHVWAGKKI